MKDKVKLCPQNFHVWVAFLMGMIVIVIAIVIFDRVSTGRLGLDKKSTTDVDIQYMGGDDGPLSNVQPASLLQTSENNSGAWLGIEAKDITEAMAEELGLGISGSVLVSRVLENSPAAKAGLLRGDIIFEFDHRDIKDTDQLSKLLGKTDPGDRVRLSVLRGDERKTLYVVLEEAENTNSTLSVRQIAGDITPDTQKWGIVISEPTDLLRKTYSIQANENGVIVMMVAPGSAASRAGLEEGDLIRQMDQTRVNSIADFFEALQSADDNSILCIYRQDAALYINMVAVFDQAQGFSMAQEGIGMNRPLYVPGYDQTQSGEPDEKTRSLVVTPTKVVSDDTVSEEDSPVCKRIPELDSFL